MSQDNHDVNPFDPFGVFKDARTTGLDAWSKLMVQLVHTDSYSQATGAMLDAWLASSQPFREVLETTFTQALKNLNLPTRDEFSSLAERLTHIELRLDDLEALLDNIQRAADKPARPSKSRSRVAVPGDQSP
ncbi:MAG: hypothetical protein U0992_18825 [Planctomycetaceae bacterium]